MQTNGNSITIDARFRGPPRSGNGGYVCGLLAEYVKGEAEVRLRLPPPLGRSLRAEQDGQERAILCDGDQVVAEARTHPISIAVPACPSHAEAQRASRSFAGFDKHWFAGCFVCGTERRAGDGLRIFAGPVGEDRLVAAPWTPDASLADDSGRVRDQFLWAALDCPGAFAVLPTVDRPVLLGTLAVEIVDRPPTEEPCIVMGWPLGSDGRKHHSGTAIFTASGKLCGKARAVWIEIAER